MSSKYASMKNAALGLLIVLLASSQAAAVQYLRPVSTASTGNFSPVGAPTLHEATDEETQNGNTDYITSGRSVTTCELNLGGSIIDPQSTSGHIVRFYFECIGGGNESVTVTLYEGANPIADSGSLSNNSGDYVEGSFTLTGAEAGNIVSYAALSVTVASSGNNKSGEEVKVTMIEMEIPDPPFSQPTISNPTVLSADTGTVRITVDDDGGVSITQHGTYWNDTGPPVTQNQTMLGTYSGGSPGTFNDTLSGSLTPQTLIYFRGYATNSQGTSFTTEATFYTETASQVAWGSITGATPSQMQINWTPVSGPYNGSIVVVKADSAVSASPVDWNEYNDNTQYGLGDTLSDGSYVVYKGTDTNVIVDGLSTGTTYHVAVFAYTGSGAVTGGINYNEAITATGSQLIVGPPLVSTPIVSSADAITATIGATVVNAGGGTLNDRGTVWNDTGPPVVEHLQSKTGAPTVGSFTHSVSGLPAGSLIYYRGYATNNEYGTAYSEDGTFYTEPANPITVMNLSDITDSSFRVNWTNVNDGAVVVVRASSAVNAVPADWTEYAGDSQYSTGEDLGSGNYVAYSGPGTTVNITDVIPGIVYHVAVFPYKGTGSGMGGINYKEETPPTASQLIVGAATLSTPAASGVTVDSANLGATVDNDGGGAIAEWGTFWNTTG
ncbi:MAG: fibronectin type III domain-containing protein, partial [Planctomycetota bacterium]